MDVSFLIFHKACVVWCDFCGCGWSEKYDAARIRLEGAKTSGQVALEKMDAAGITVPKGVREVINHLAEDEGVVTLDVPQLNPGRTFSDLTCELATEYPALSTSNDSCSSHSTTSGNFLFSSYRRLVNILYL